MNKIKNYLFVIMQLTNKKMRTTMSRFFMQVIYNFRCPSLFDSFDIFSARCLSKYYLFPHATCFCIINIIFINKILSFSNNSFSNKIIKFILSGWFFSFSYFILIFCLRHILMSIFLFYYYSRYSSNFFVFIWFYDEHK